MTEKGCEKEQKCIAMLSPQQTMRMMYMVELMRTHFGLPPETVEKGILQMLADADLIHWEEVSGESIEEIQAAQQRLAARVVAVEVFAPSPAKGDAN